MKHIIARRFVLCLAAGFFIISTVSTIGCAGSRINVEYEKDDSSEYSEDNSEYTEADLKHKHKKGGPPPHAPAHGYRANHHYQYYPSSSVYYDSDREIYFYLKGDNWEVGTSLPSSISLRIGDYISIEMNTDKPYTHHADHVKRYPPGQMKKKKKKDKWG